MTDAERLLEAVEKKSEPHLRAIRKRIEDGTATFADTAEYSRIVSELLGRELSEEVLGLTDREGTAEALLCESYNDTNEVCAQVQTALDEKKGLHLAPQKAPFPAERVAQFAHSLVDPTVPDDKIQRRAKSGTENISMSFHDDFIEQNAEFRERAGLKCYVTRTSSGNCCPWCTAVAGKYLMSEQPEGLFRRHDNCDCVIVYDGQVLRGQKGENGRRNKKWVEDKAARIEFTESVPKPVVNSPEQAKELEKQLTSGENGGIIESEINLSPTSIWDKIRAFFSGSDKKANVSNEEIISALQGLGFSKVDESFFKNTDEILRMSITDQLQILESKFHAIGSSNAPTISANLKGGATASVKSELNNPENQNLSLSVRDFRNNKRHISARRKEVEDFFCMPCDTDDNTLSRYVITHEYGHMLENSIAAQDMKGTINTFPRLTERYREQIEKIARTIDPDYDNNKSGYLSSYAREECSYAHKNEEFFAECFANSQLGQPNVLGQAMLQWLEKRGF